MNSRTQRWRSDAWRTMPVAVLCPAVAVLLAALVICLGYTAHTSTSPAPATPMAAMSTAQTPAGDRAEHHAVTVAHPGDCPSGDVCCDRSAHGVRAVLPATVQALPASLPRLPSLTAPDALSCPTGLPPTRGAPDLHVLQVQRT